MFNSYFKCANFIYKLAWFYWQQSYAVTTQNSCKHCSVFYVNPAHFIKRVREQFAIVNFTAV